MHIPEYIANLFRRCEKPVDEAVSTRRGQFVPAPNLRQATVPPWWLRESLARQRSGIPGEMEEPLAARVADCVRKGRVSCVSLPKGAHEVLVLALHRIEQKKHLLELLHESPYLITRELVRLVKDETEGEGVGLKEIERRLGQLEPQAVIETLLRAVAQGALTGGTLQGTAEGAMLWEHAVATAVAAERLCEAYHIRGRTTVYLAALLHDVGRAAIYWTLRSLCDADNLPDTEFQARLADKLHEQAGLVVARKWRLPHGIASVIGNHHGRIDEGDKLANLRVVIQLAEQIALHCGHGDEKPEGILLEHPAAKRIGLTAEKAPDILEPIPHRMLVATLL